MDYLLKSPLPSIATRGMSYTAEKLWRHIDCPCKMKYFCITPSFAAIQFYGETLINFCHRMSVTSAALFVPTVMYI